jgi:eukaryotic-like serine/threonine-protein kinase
MRSHIAHYEIVSELGRGGMGVVYKAYEPALTRYVAIKELSPALAHDQSLIERFLREARSMAALNDPHIIQIYFIGQENNQPFFVMEFVDGESLSAIIKNEGRLEVSDALKVLHQSAQGLSTAHEKGVVHRDIKPGNLLLNSRGQIKVADFGIALANHDFNSKLTGTGQFVGTPGYISPELCLGKVVDHRSDIFALGVVFFEMLTGRVPFFDESPLKQMLAVVEEQVPDVRALNGTVDDEVARILSKMLEKDPANRYQSCEELIVDLEKTPQIAQGGGIKVKAKPLTGAAATMIAPTPDRQPHFRAPTPPPKVGNTPANSGPPPVPSQASQAVASPAPVKAPPSIPSQSVAAQAAPAHVAAPAPAQQAAPARPNPQQVITEVSTRKNNSVRSSSGGTNWWLAAGLGVMVLGVLVVGGAWAWKTISDQPSAPSEMIGATIDTTSTDTQVPVVADDVAAIESGTQNATAALEDKISTLANGANDEANDSTSGAQQIASNSPPVEKSVSSKGVTYSTSTPADTSVANADSGEQTSSDSAQGSGIGKSVAIVTSGDRDLVNPAKEFLQEELQSAGFDIAAPRRARWVITVNADVVDRQRLEFYGQSDLVTTANFSIKVRGRNGQTIGSGVRERIDYTPANAEDKVELVIDDAIDDLKAKLQE